jgi:hypothetical protein
MAKRVRRTGARASEDGGDEGAERYMWAFREGTAVILSIPGIRDLTLSADEARTIGRMLIDTADDADREKSSNESQLQ